MKGITTKLVTVAAVLMIAATGSASESGGADPHLTIDPSTLQVVDMALLQLQQEISQKNYSSMLFKSQMMEKMMGERTSQNYMQNSIQPVMMEKMRAGIKTQQMEIMKDTASPDVPSL